MKELNTPNQDKLEISATAPIKKELKHIGSLIPHKGHTCWELDLKTGDVIPAVFDTTAVAYESPSGITKKLIIKENCIYTTALNKKNAFKHFKKMLFV